MEQVNDQLDLVHAFEIGDFGLVACVDERLESAHDEFGQTAAQYGLLTEKVGLRFLGKGGRQYASPGSAEAVGVGQCTRLSLPGHILVHRHQAGHAAAGFVLPPDQVARSLRCDQDHVQIIARRDSSVMYVESVGEQNRRIRADHRQDSCVDFRLNHVGREKGDQTGPFGSLLEGLDRKSVVLGPGPRGAVRTQTHRHVIARVPQVQGMGASLAAIAQDRDPFTAKRLRMGVRFFKQFHCSDLSVFPTIRGTKKTPQPFGCGACIGFRRYAKCPHPQRQSSTGRSRAWRVTFISVRYKIRVHVQECA